MENRNAIIVDPKKKLKSAKVTAERIISVLPICSNFKILDVGCGGGELLKILSEKTGADCYGVEPFPMYEFIFDNSKILKAKAEDLPFTSNSFDLVICVDVLEHVDNIEKALSELIRVSRKFIYIRYPNYLYPYEPHFKKPFFPYLPKTLARLYFKLLGFSSEEVSFINHINYLNKISLLRYLKNYDNVSVVIDLQLSKNFRKKRYILGFIDIVTNSKCEFLIIKKNTMEEH